MNKPFENLTVLDLSRYLLGAYPSLYLADFGARVIKVEDTKVGDYCVRKSRRSMAKAITTMRSTVIKKAFHSI